MPEPQKWPEPPRLLVPRWPELPRLSEPQGVLAPRFRGCRAGNRTIADIVLAGPVVRRIVGVTHQASLRESDMMKAFVSLNRLQFLTRRQHQQSSCDVCRLLEG